jgi:putative ABC transport system permease protein
VWTRWQAWKTGAKSLMLHPLRSLLTILGIFIGVASVIWLLAIGEGISRGVQRQIEGLGADNIIVRSIKPPAELNAARRGVVPYGLTRDDWARLRDTIPTVKGTVPVREIRREFRVGDRFVDGRLVGCTPEYAAITRIHVDRGRWLTDSDESDRKKVCVLASETARRLFPIEDPVGRSIRVDRDYYQVVGVMQSRQPTAAIGGSLDSQDFSNDVYVPLATLWSLIGDIVVTRRSGSFEGENVQLNQVTVQVRNVADVLETADVVKETLQKYHRNADWGVVVPLELLEQARTMKLMFMLFLGAIAAISLVVGGIGIMNIMLATVTERTREIGIRRALGANQKDIIRQFLRETVMLSALGGVAGIAGGYACGPAVHAARWIVERFLPDVIRQLPESIRTLEPEVVLWSIPLAFGISVLVGVVFGLYPAQRAARLDPIDALRTA